MSYLNRDERREVILQAAMRVALAEGFTAMTVRRIASEADVAAGGASPLQLGGRAQSAGLCPFDPHPA